LGVGGVGSHTLTTRFSLSCFSPLHSPPSSIPSCLQCHIVRGLPKTRCRVPAPCLFPGPHPRRTSVKAVVTVAPCTQMAPPPVLATATSTSNGCSRIWPLLPFMKTHGRKHFKDSAHKRRKRSLPLLGLSYVYLLMLATHRLIPFSKGKGKGYSPPHINPRRFWPAVCWFWQCKNWAYCYLSMWRRGIFLSPHQHFTRSDYFRSLRT
jgi:hypothetical protein